MLRRHLGFFLEKNCKLEAVEKNMIVVVFCRYSLERLSGAECTTLVLLRPVVPTALDHRACSFKGVQTQTLKND